MKKTCALGAGLLTLLAAVLLTGSLLCTPPAQASPSTDFVFSGLGYGHGVGMSQWGAWEMAKEGHPYPDIFSFYYPGTSLASTPDTTLTVKISSSPAAAVSALTQNYVEVDLSARTGTGTPSTPASLTLITHDSQSDHTETIPAGESASVVSHPDGSIWVDIAGVWQGPFDQAEGVPSTDSDRVMIQLTPQPAQPRWPPASTGAPWK